MKTIVRKRQFGKDSHVTRANSQIIQFPERLNQTSVVHHPDKNKLSNDVQMSYITTPEITKPSVSYLIDEWLNIKRLEVRKEAYEIYCSTAEKHIMPFFDELDIPLQDVKLLHLQKYFSEKLKDLKASSLKKHYTILNGTFDYSLYNLNIICSNPMTKVKMPKLQPRFF